jgi:hypothetical protein
MSHPIEFRVYNEIFGEYNLCTTYQCPIFHSGENGTSSSFDHTRPPLHPNGIHTSTNSSTVNGASHHGFSSGKDDDLDNCSDEEFSDLMDQSSDNSLDSAPYPNHVTNPNRSQPHAAMS